VEVEVEGKRLLDSWLSLLLFILLNTGAEFKFKCVFFETLPFSCLFFPPGPHVSLMGRESGNSLEKMGKGEV
jgi:hypothetical protein